MSLPITAIVITAIITITGITLIKIGVNKHPGLMRKAILLTGSSLLGIPVFTVLHNLLYAGAELATIAFLKTICEILYVSFFLLLVIVCPVGFIAGIIWIILIVRGYTKGGQFNGN